MKKVYNVYFELSITDCVNEVIADSEAEALKIASKLIDDWSYREKVIQDCIVNNEVGVGILEVSEIGEIEE